MHCSDETDIVALHDLLPLDHANRSIESTGKVIAPREYFRIGKA